VEQLAHGYQRVAHGIGRGCARPIAERLITRALLKTASPAASLEGRLVDQRARLSWYGSRSAASCL
jgi:hypothetical protein